MKIQNYGKIIALIGVAMVLFSQFMPISIDGSGVINFHLMSKQQNMLLFGGLVFVAGIILYAVSKIKNGNGDIKKEVDSKNNFFDIFEASSINVEDRNCPFCAESIKAQAVLCRYCGSSVSPVKLTENLATNKNSFNEYSESIKLSAKDDSSLVFQISRGSAFLLFPSIINNFIVMNIYRDKVVIAPKSFLGLIEMYIQMRMKGPITIPFSSITEISFKEAGFVFLGNLYFNFLVGNDNKSQFVGKKRKIIFLFKGRENNDIAEKIQKYIDAYILAQRLQK